MNYYASLPQRAGLILNLNKDTPCLIPNSCHSIPAKAQMQAQDCSPSY